MPRKVAQTQRFLELTENLSVLAISRPERQARRRRRRGERGSAHPQTGEELGLPPYDSLMRTRRLLMAALRVWELRHGIHEPY
jgi:hypothetical protein